MLRAPGASTCSADRNIRSEIKALSIRSFVKIRAPRPVEGLRGIFLANCWRGAQSVARIKQSVIRESLIPFYSIQATTSSHLSRANGSSTERGFSNPRHYADKNVRAPLNSKLRDPRVLEGSLQNPSACKKPIAGIKVNLTTISRNHLCPYCKIFQISFANFAKPIPFFG